jgi:hypothetical protein
LPLGEMTCPRVRPPYKVTVTLLHSYPPRAKEHGG